MEEWIGLVPVLVPVLVPGLAAPTAQRSGDENDGTRSCRRKSILLRPRLHRLARAAISRAATARWLRLVVFSAGFLSCTWPHFGNDFWVFVCLFSFPPPQKKWVFCTSNEFSPVAPTVFFLLIRFFLPSCDRALAPFQFLVILRMNMLDIERVAEHGSGKKPFDAILPG